MVTEIRKYEVSVGHYGSDEMTVIEGPWENTESEDECEKMFREMNDGFLHFDKISIDRV